jgi:hypothetical protein
MLFNKETRYWQKEYREGRLDNVGMLGETRALLDGSAEKGFWVIVKVMCIVACLLLALCIWH